jgi:hypothetical protein
MSKQNSKELLEIIAHDINEIDLTHYTAIYRIGDLANRLINVINVVGNEIFNESQWCSECGGAIEAGVCIECNDDSNYKGDN